MSDKEQDRAHLSSTFDRKPYGAPQLTKLGSVHGLTAAGTGQKSEAEGNDPQMDDPNSKI